MLLASCSAAYAQGDSLAEQEALTASGVAGEILDTAVEHCRRGESAQALSMFGAIRAQLDPPPAIAQLIRELEATGCKRPETAGGGVLRLQLGSGWDSNVSQGISARTLAIGSGENVIELELDDSHRPRASAFVQASADYSVLHPASGINLQAGLAHRKNTSASAFDITSLSAAASREFNVLQGSARFQVELAEVWLAQRHYQRTQGLGLQWLRAGERGAWLATLGATHVDYLTQRAHNAWQWEGAVLRELRLNAAQSVHAGISVQHDSATGDRPGGDRKGFGLQFGGVALAYGWRFRPQLNYTHWDTEEVFAPGLLDVKRRNRLIQASFTAEKPISARTTLVFEWRGRRARDTVALYRYQAQTFSATLAHRF